MFKLLPMEFGWNILLICTSHVDNNMKLIRFIILSLYHISLKEIIMQHGKCLHISGNAHCILLAPYHITIALGDYASMLK